MLPSGDLEQAANMLRIVFCCEVRILEPRPEPAGAYDPARGQYNSALILRDLVDSCPADADRLLGLTEHDLFIPMLSFVFGQAQLGGRVALVSFARLRQEFYGLGEGASVFAERARKEILHELGHTFGLTHCADRGCPMSLSTGISQVDDKGRDYCEPCVTQLREHKAPLVLQERNT
jgi:archaemetzincin